MFRIALFFIPFLAQAIEFRSYVDKKELGVNQTVKLNLELQSEDSLPEPIECLDIFGLQGFDVVGEFQSGPNFSVISINGKVTQSRSLVKSYILQPQRTGTFIIPPLSVTAGDKSFKTQSFTIKVLTDSTTSPAPNPRVNPFQHHFFNSPFGPSLDPFRNVEPPRRKRDWKLKLKLKKKEFYQSETIRADWFLYYSSRQPYFEFLAYPPLKGFLIEDVTLSKPITETEAIGDTLYRKRLVKSLWLFPLEVGELTIKPYSLNVFSFSSQRLSSPSQKIRVKKLPLAGQRPSFTGAVGDFTVDFILQESEVSLNQPFSFKIVFKGSGHPRFISLPDLSFPSSVQTYDPVEKSHFEKGIGSKEYEILILPQQEGELILPSIEVSTFDPQTGQYILHTSPEFKLFVKKGEGGDENRSESFFDKTSENPPQLQQTRHAVIVFLKRYQNRLVFLVFLVLIVPLLFLLLWLVKKVIAGKKQSIVWQWNKKSSRIQKLLDQKDWQKAGMAMIQAGIFVLSCVQMQSLSPDWRQALKALPPSIHKKYANSFEKLFMELEALSFSRDSKQQALKRAKHCFSLLKKLSQSFLKETKAL